MFTVKHIKSDGTEHLMTSDHGVTFSGGALLVAVGAMVAELKDGKAYVMNAAGQTVAAYTLGVSPAGGNSSAR